MENKYVETRTLGAIVVSLMTLMIFLSLGCSKNSGGSGSNYGFATNCANPTCSIGGSPGLSYIALSPSTQQALTLYNNELVNYAYDTSYWFNRSQLQVGNSTLLLSTAMGVCNRETNVGGLADCSTWSNAANALIISAPSPAPNAATLNFWSTPIQNGNSTYSYQFPSTSYLLFGLLGVPVPTNPQAYYDPMNLNTTYTQTNAGQGFELRGYGPTGGNAQNEIFQFQVAQGQFGISQGFSFQLYLNGTQVASGSMIQCMSPGCAQGF